MLVNLLPLLPGVLPLDATVAGESWPILGAFLALQTTITAPILGYVIKQNADLRGEKEKRLADKDALLAQRAREHERDLAAKDKEIERLNGRCDQFMEMAFAAVQGFDQSTVVAQDATNIAKVVTGRRGLR